MISRFRSKVSVFGPCLTPFICWPADLDVLRHMNNGRYFSIMDLGRVDLMIRAGIATQLSENGWYPVVVAESMRFRRSIDPFVSFSVETTVLGWDDKAFILRQRFIKGQTCFAEAMVRARFLKKTGGSVLPNEILKLVHVDQESPHLPETVRLWNLNQID